MVSSYFSSNDHPDDDMGQGIQEWTKWNLWKTAFKKFEVIWSAFSSVCNQAFDHQQQQIRLANELESDLQGIVD